jgi:uncharacterized protein DUF2834
MQSNRLFLLYLVLALLALGLTWVHVPYYLGAGFVQANIRFWQDALLNANPAGVFLTVDILFLALVANIWMVIESRRQGIRYVWAYVLVGIFVAISFAFPLFLAVREKHMASLAQGAPVTKLTVVDRLLLCVLFVGTVGVAVWAI